MKINLFLLFGPALHRSSHYDSISDNSDGSLRHKQFFASLLQDPVRNDIETSGTQDMNSRPN